jgi:hypothetical protein
MLAKINELPLGPDLQTVSSNGLEALHRRHCDRRSPSLLDDVLCEGVLCALCGHSRQAYDLVLLDKIDSLDLRY